MYKAIPILLYHSITDEVTAGFRNWSLAPAMFAAHLRYLHEQKYNAITVTQLVRALRGDTKLPSKPIVLSFDDGLADFYTAALPILRQVGMPASLYVVTGFLGATSGWLQAEGEAQCPMLTWTQLREIERDGIEIGAHTHTHPQLDTLSEADAWKEIVRSKQQLEEYLGHRIESFAYPHGYHSAQVRQLVARAGFSSACAVKHALSAADADLYSLARVIMTNDVCVNQLDRLLQGDRLPVAPRGEPLRTKMWRLARRSLRAMEQLRIA
ncbi:MAG: polysaccharide deacetylase family protein [Caldilineaceae bacterium]